MSIELSAAAIAETWPDVQREIAERAGLAVLLIDGRQPPSLAVANNNSICRVLQSSAQYAELCNEYCGQAFARLLETDAAEYSFKCHAGLSCTATKLADGATRLLAAIVGRAFASVDDYQKLLDRVHDGDLRDFPTAELLGNLLFAATKTEPSEIAARLRRLSDDEQRALNEFVARAEPNPFDESAARQSPIKTWRQLLINADNSAPIETITIENAPPTATNEVTVFAENYAAANLSESQETLADFTAWQMFTDVLLDLSFKEACAETLRFLSVRFDLSALAWLELAGKDLKPFIIGDKLRDQAIDVNVSADDARLLEAAAREMSFELSNANHNQTIEIFPLAVGEDVRAALLVGETINSALRRARIAKFCRQIAVPLEVLRLREELARRARVVRAVQIFNEKFRAADGRSSTAELFDLLIQTCAEILQAERASLLIFDEDEQRLKVTAAVGHNAEHIKHVSSVVGERIAERVWREAKPVVVENVTMINLPPAPPEREYKSKSFISFPLAVSNRVVGVLNVTDKIGGASYDAGDLELLEAVAPQLAIALDRAKLQQKAGRFEQLSITDSLTGLVNRRYLNERIAEEVKRSLRDDSPMSFMMIDIDNFKLYNDQFGHQAGDEVLRVVSQSLRSVLRGADVAARFGGEEFCLLLPQTTLDEAGQIAERIRQHIEETQFPHRAVTVSIGVADFSPVHNNTAVKIIEAADRALYQAKRAGKNNVQLWTPTDFD